MQYSRQRSTWMFAKWVVTVTGLVWAHSVSAQDTTLASDPFMRYARPGQCVQAASRLTDFYWRDKRPDTVVYAPATDTVPALALSFARECSSRFSVSSVPEADLLGLVQLYLWTQQDDLAYSATDRLLKASAKQPALQRGWTLYLIAISYLNARPVRWDRATKYLAQLDSMGSVAGPWRLMAHIEFSKYAMTLDDLTTAQAQGTAALGASKQLSKGERIDRAYTILNAYAVLAEPLAIRAGGRAAVTLFDTASTDLLPLRAPSASDASSGSASSGDNSGPDVIIGRNGISFVREEIRGGMNRGGMGAAAQMMLQQAIAERRSPYTILDTVGPAIHDVHWYNTGADTALRPKFGVVSLLISVNANCGAPCYPTYSSIRRLYDKYHSAGLQVVLVASTGGFFRNQPVSPAGESDKTQAYYLDFLKLPGVMAVRESKFSFKPDRRRMNELGQEQRSYFNGRNAAIVGKDGVVRMTVDLAPNRERAVSAVIASELAK